CQRVDQLLEAAVRRYAQLHAGQAVENGVAHRQPLDFVSGLIEETVRRQLDRRNITERQQSALFEQVQIPAQALREAAYLIWRLFEHEQDAGFTAARPLEQRLQTQQRLASSGSTLNDGRAGPWQAAAEHGVEAGHAGRHALEARDGPLLVRCGLFRSALRTAYAREEAEP